MSVKPRDRRGSDRRRRQTDDDGTEDDGSRVRWRRGVRSVGVRGAAADARVSRLRHRKWSRANRDRGAAYAGRGRARIADACRPWPNLV